LAEWTALGMSLGLNILGGGGDSLAKAWPHAIGPLGCAGTAFLIGLFDSYVTAAKPWDGAPRLSDIDDLTAAVPATGVTAVPDSTTGTRGRTVPARVGTGAPVPGRTSTGPGRRSVPASGTSGRRAITGRTGTGTGTAPTSAKATARAFWEAEIAAGRTPSGAELARAAGKDNDDSGVFRRWAREWSEQNQGGTDAAAS
jgi:hypothetical protein